MENLKRQKTWYNKTINQFNNAELNDFYLSTLKDGKWIISDGLVYKYLESFGFPQTNGTTKDQDKLLDKVSKEFAKKVREAGFLTKIMIKSRNIGNSKHKIYTVYIRDTPNSDITKIPTYNKAYFEHLTKFKNIPMKNIIQYKR